MQNTILLITLIHHYFNQIVNVMNQMKSEFRRKRSGLIVIICFVQLFFFGQIYAQAITLHQTDKLVREVIHIMEKNNNLLFFYNNGDVDMDRKVTIKVDNVSIEKVLDLLFAGTPNTYKIDGRQIYILKKTVKEAVSPREQPKKRITGKITDANGEAIIGTNIIEKGTGNGTVTDIDGNFTLNVAPNAQLQISYIGYLPQEIPVAGKASWEIVLQEDTQALDEVVVVGYGTQRKVNLSGAVESISSKTLENRATNNVALALQGIVSNLTITPTSGQADDIPGINIRGTTSINGGEPLILVDGVPTSATDFVRMNSMDIDNISVLKDASSAAIYGARAAFGVILVTTKKGQGKEKLKILINNNFSIRTLTRMPKIVQDPYIQASYKKEMGKPWYDLYTDGEISYALQRRNNPSLPGTILKALDPSKYTYLDNTSWYDEVFDKSAYSHQHNLSISGATSNISYYLGVEYYQERGLLKIRKDIFDRYNVRTNVDFRPTNWLTIGNNTALTLSSYDKPTNFGNWLFSQILQTNTLVPIKNPDGSYTREGSLTVGTLKEGGESKKRNSTVHTQFTVDIELIKNIWNVKADFTTKLLNDKLNEWDSDRAIPYRDGPESPDKHHAWSNYAQRSFEKSSFTMFNLYTNFRKNIGIHNFSAITGFSQECETYEYFLGSKKNLIADTYPTPNLASGEMTITENKQAWAVRSGFYRLNYTLDEKYIIETNGRYDGTSRFRKDSRFGFFPSFSTAWIVSNEPFFKPLHHWVNHFKLRTSYGLLGNQLTSDRYPYIAIMNAGKVNFLINGEKPMGIYPPGLVSNALTWEKVYTINGGIDANFFQNRLTISTDIYRRDTKDMLTKGKTLPNVLGTTEPNINAADLKTTGWELSMLWRDSFSVRNAPFHYSARFILSDSRSFITKFDNPTGYLGKTFEDFYVGREFGEIWGLETLGFFKDQADIDSSPDQWTVTAYPGDRPIEPGDLKYKNLNGDDKIDRGAYTLDNPGDAKIIGNNKSRYNFGVDINTDWNGFDFRLFIQGVGKKDFYPTGFVYKFFSIYTGPWGNVFETTLDHWTPENPDGYFPRLKSYINCGDGDLSIPQTRYLQNAAYLRVKNLTFGYTLPICVISPLKLENARLYFSGENLFEITKLNKNYDPEGLQQDTHPFQRTFSIGLNITL